MRENQREKVAEALRETERLVRSGWVQAMFECKVMGQTCYCLVGALQKAVRRMYEDRGDVVYGNALEALKTQVYRLFPATHWGSTWETTCLAFNDDPHTRRKDVLKVVVAARKAVLGEVAA